MVITLSMRSHPAVTAGAAQRVPGDPQVTPSILTMPILGESEVCGVRDFNDLTAFVRL